MLARLRDLWRRRRKTRNYGRSRWTHLNDGRLASTITLIAISWLSGLGWTRWSHFDGCNLWNDRYPHTERSRILLWMLRMLFMLQIIFLVVQSISWVIFRRLHQFRTWRVLANSKTIKLWLQEHRLNRWFVVAYLADVYRALMELSSLVLFLGLYVDSVAVMPPKRHLLSWLVDLFIEGVIGLVPLVSWLLPAMLTILATASMSSVWEEAVARQRSQRRFSLSLLSDPDNSPS
jgi:hypothetical protein